MEQEKVIYINRAEQFNALIQELNATNDFLSYYVPRVNEAKKRRFQLNKILEQWLEEGAAEAAGK